MRSHSADSSVDVQPDTDHQALARAMRLPEIPIDSALPRYKDLDGIRGVAALLVLYSHTRWPIEPFLQGLGDIGVWLFFVLSGFLLANPFLAGGIALDRNSVVAYLTRRFFRIVPMFWCCLPFYLMFYGTLWDASRVWRNLTFMSGDQHFWSIRQEILCYLILPALLGTLALVRGQLAKLMIAIGIAAGLHVAFVSAHVFTFELSGRSWPFWISPFVAGVSLAVASGRVPVHLGRLLSVAGCLGLVTIACSFGDEEIRGSSIMAILAIACCAVLVLGATLQSNLITSSGVLRAIGKIGYSFYLWHILVLVVVQQQSALLGHHLTGWPLFLAAIGLTAVMSWLTYQLVEEPAIRLGRILADRISPLALSVAVSRTDSRSLPRR
jgi:peptidoglycan/LPS O-acetylase OafA/YrhL